jgi:hypothetical protein
MMMPSNSLLHCAILVALIVLLFHECAAAGHTPVDAEEPELLRYTKTDIDAARANGFAQGLVAAMTESNEPEQTEGDADAKDDSTAGQRDPVVPTFDSRFEASAKNVKTLFSTPLMQVQLEPDLDLLGIKTVILDHLEDAERRNGDAAVKGTHKSTRRGWHSDQLQGWPEGCSSCNGPFAALWNAILHHLTQMVVLEASGAQCDAEQCAGISHTM